MENLNIMNKKEIENYNRICAEFLKMEYEAHSNTWRYKNEITSQLLFHSDWNWIILVLKSITKIGYNWELIDFNGSVNEKNFMKCSIFNLEFGKSHIKFTCESSDETEAVVEVINQFLIWYNKNK